MYVIQGVAMNKYNHSKASLFLMELMLNILFFSVLVTICLQLFFKAHNLSESTTILHRAVTTSSSIAEIYQNNYYGKESILHIYPDAIELNQNIIIYFDDEFVSCPKEEGSYRAKITIGDDALRTAVIEFSKVDNDEIIYSLTVSAYEPQTLSSVSGGDANE